MHVQHEEISKQNKQTIQKKLPGEGGSVHTVHDLNHWPVRS